MLAFSRKRSSFIRTKSHRRKTSPTPAQNWPHLLSLAPGEFIFPDISRPTSFPNLSIRGVFSMKRKLWRWNANLRRSHDLKIYVFWRCNANLRLLYSLKIKDFYRWNAIWRLIVSNIRFLMLERDLEALLQFENRRLLLSWNAVWRGSFASWKSTISDAGTRFRTGHLSTSSSASTSASRGLNGGSSWV